MQMIITDAWLARSRVLHLSAAQIVLLFLVSAVLLMFMALGLYHWVFIKGAREGWPVISDLVRLVVKDDIASRDLFMRQNLDAMARQLGEMQAKLTQLESLGERVSGLAGLPVKAQSTMPGSGGLQVASRVLSLDELQTAMGRLELATDQRAQWLTDLESRLFDRRLEALMIPTQSPLDGVDVGSRFGWRIDPFTGRSALHTGLDFSADVGQPFLAAAGGMVIAATTHPEYGQMLEIDHGNEVVTRYAHASKLLVRQGQLVKRGQRIGLVGNTGRSTGPHLHFEVLVRDVWQDPQKFLAVGERKEFKNVAAILAAPAKKTPRAAKKPSR
jgi:murein DD-endopeptidase MepM/ murein hydrolase activator NlpD